MQLTNLAIPTRAALLLVLKSPVGADLRRSGAQAKALAAASVAMMLAIATPIASAQQVTVGTRILAMIALQPGDLGAYGMRVSTATTPTANYQNDPSPNNCTYGVIYFGLNGNPSAADRTNFMMLSTQGLIGTNIGITYTKTATAIAGGFKCVLDRYDMNY